MRPVTARIIHIHTLAHTHMCVIKKKEIQHKPQLEKSTVCRDVGSTFFTIFYKSQSIESTVYGLRSPFTLWARRGIRHSAFGT